MRDLWYGSCNLQSNELLNKTVGCTLRVRVSIDQLTNWNEFMILRVH